MCGIAGIVRWDGQAPPPAVLQAMCGVMSHRGPDDEGFYLNDSVGLGMRRLSIIDLSTGHQPVPNEEGTLWVIFNGEIYNFRELRQDLHKRGHTLKTSTDTEVIVHLYEDFGPRCVDVMNGMFAFAVWDVRRRELFLARDRLGIKPLYYAQLDGALVFASELKSILCVPEIRRTLNWTAISHLFTFLTTPASQSVIDGVRKLEPGHRATLTRDGQLSIERYWDVAFDPDERTSERDLVEQLRELLESATALQLRSDVPLGAFLSGGIDSSAIVATAKRLVPGRIKTFSIGFTEREYDELQYARQVAKAFGTDHYELVLEPQPLDIAEKLTWYLDEPFGDSSAIPTYMVSKLAAEHVKVVLSGDGGDELFAGYDRYVLEQREQSYDRVPRPLRKALGRIGDAMPEGMKGRNFLRHLALDGMRRYIDASALFRSAEQRKLFQPDVCDQMISNEAFASAVRVLESCSGRWLSAVQYWDLRNYLPLDILTKVDRMTMAHSIEARPVLLDHRLVEFAARIPPRLVLRGTTTKYLFRQAMRGILPDTIINRPKHGFAVPLSHWFRRDWAGFVRDLLRSDTCRQRGIFNPQYIEQLLRHHARGRNLDLQLWTMVSFEQWCRMFLDGPRLAACSGIRQHTDVQAAQLRNAMTVR